MSDKARRSSLTTDEEQLTFFHLSPPREHIVPLRRISSFTDGLVRARSDGSPSPMHLDSGEICPMVTRLHVAARKGMRRSRSRSLGAQQERYMLVDRQKDRHTIEAPFSVDLLETESLEKPHTSPAVVTVAHDIGETYAAREEGNPVWISAMYGLINAVIVLPVLMSFGSIIYRDEAFVPHMPVLVKLTVISGMVHQVCFSVFSSLPFAIGQVQDAGLIFLSSMARDIVKYCRNGGYDDEALLATVTIGLGLATALLGLGLVMLGKCRLAQYVQLLPTCVIGGYLAFIGWFCGMSGLELMAGGGDMSLDIFADKIIFLLPGILGGMGIYMLVRRLQHMAVLPVCISLLFISFYVILYLTNTSLEQATEVGWIRQSEAPPVWYHTWDYLKFDKVVWAALPFETLTLFSMIFVVALSSSLDVAAIELELKRPLDYNHELTTVGVSNVVSGLLGGYTGSYIFSQSIFSLRAGVRSRLSGFVLAISELVVLILPFPILSFVPNFFFGSLLVMICIDLMHEWLWHVQSKVTGAEYCICLVTFILIQILGVEYGILAGVALYIVCRKLGVDIGEVERVKRIDEENLEILSAQHERNSYGTAQG